MDNPFELGGNAYRDWRDRKLACRPESADELRVSIEDPDSLRDSEIAALRTSLARANCVIYRLRDANVDGRLVLRRIGKALGLRKLVTNPYADLDGITALSDRPEAARKGYIPYSPRALNWHTDGYYNEPEQKIRAFSMHCAVPAAVGGGNRVIDHELVYIALRDRDPALIEALMRPDAMTIPARVEDGVEIRPACVGPVFSVDGDALHMRYTARTRSIEWSSDPVVQRASKLLVELLESGEHGVLQFRLEAGEGLVCNNILHSREAYQDAPGASRLMYRARYCERVNKTVLATRVDDICSNVGI